MTVSSQEQVARLQAAGVSLPLPESVFIGPDVDADRISGDGVVIHPGCRITGHRTVISAGCVLGEEGPVTLHDCALGPRVRLKGGYAASAVFLADANLGLGHHVREGSILEEEASGAHCVGLKQTILFPFATLGSLINFCDCLLAGGTSRSDHSEVGSSYIHFNFTPDGNKTTASLFGDVPRGVMLDQPPVFLGGQGGAVGPVYTGFGTVVGAGSVLRSDVDDDGHLVLESITRNLRRPMAAGSYRGLRRILERNVTYVASLWALDAWYSAVRRPFFEAEASGAWVLEGALRALASGRDERIKRLGTMIDKLPGEDGDRAEIVSRRDAFLAALSPEAQPVPASLAAAVAQARGRGLSYLSAIQGLDADARAAGTDWLADIVSSVQRRAARVIPASALFSA